VSGEYPKGKADRMVCDAGGARHPLVVAAVSRAALGVMGLLLVSGSLQAQHVLRGQVVDSAGTGLSGVEIVLAEAERRGVTDSGGRYALWNIPAGRYEVVFRRLGYAPFVMFRSFQGDTGTTVVEVRLAAEAVVLPEVETKARGPEAVPVKLRDWARRRENNVGGKFWDDSLLRTQEYRRLPEVLQLVSGARIIRWKGKRFLAVGGGRIPLGSTQGGIARSSLPNDPDQLPGACYSLIFLDGVKLAFSTEPPNLDDIPVHQLAAIEFYRSASEMPAVFNLPGANCGVLALWTR